MKPQWLTLSPSPLLHKARGLIAALVTAACLPACSLLPPPQPAPSLHDFGPTTMALAVPGSRVRVDAPVWLQDERLRYRLMYDDPTQVRFYAQARWLASPAELLSQRLAPALAPQQNLRVRLTDLEQVFDSPTQARIVLRLLAQLENSDGQVLAELPFDFSRPAEPNRQGALRAYAAALDEAVLALQRWLNSSTP